MMWKLMVVFLFVSTQSVFARADITKRIWGDNSGNHTLIIKKQRNAKEKGEYLIVEQITDGKNNWILKDYVRDCDVDIKLDVINESVEVNKKIADDEGFVLFAYKIGCVGGIDPVTVKYFAYRDGVKYALRGEEHIIIGGDSFGGEKPPVPDFNLRNKKALMGYMLKKWNSISTTKIN